MQIVSALYSIYIIFNVLSAVQDAVCCCCRRRRHRTNEEPSLHVLATLLLLLSLYLDEDHFTAQKLLNNFPHEYTEYSHLLSPYHISQDIKI